MSLVDLLVTILVATILITVGIGLVTYLVYKLRYARVRRGEEDAEGGADGRYFETYPPPDGDEAEDASVTSAGTEPRGA